MITKASKKTYHFINRNEHLRQFVVYFFIGGLSAVSDLFLLFIFVDYFHIFYLIAATISFSIISTAAFFLHKNYTFRHKERASKNQYFVFLIVAGSGLLWSLFFLFLFVSVFKLYYLVAAIIVKFIVLAWNFLMNKFVTFHKVKNIDSALKL